VYAVGDVPSGCALAIPVVPTNPVATAPDATSMAAPNKIRNFTLTPLVYFAVHHCKGWRTGRLGD
jgi:hypothetical protein